MVSKPSPAVHRSAELVNFLKGFSSTHKFHKWINDMESVLKGNMFAGDCIRKKQIPSHMKDRKEAHELIRGRNCGTSALSNSIEEYDP
jgi:hypothetical protein